MRGSETNQRMKWKDKESKYKKVKWNWKKMKVLRRSYIFEMEWSTVKFQNFMKWYSLKCEISFPFEKWRNFIRTGYWDCSLYTFGIWASYGDGDHSSSGKLPLGFGLVFRELQSIQLQENWGWKRHAKVILAGHHLCCFYIFLIWTSHGDQNLNPCDKMPLGLELRLREEKSLEHWGWKMHAKRITAVAQYCCLPVLQMRAINGDGHLATAWAC